jgi:hypothetical protein
MLKSALLVTTGIVIGAGAISALNAQSSTPYFNVSAINVTDKDGYEASGVDKVREAIKANGGKLIAGGYNKAVAIDSDVQATNRFLIFMYPNKEASDKAWEATRRAPPSHGDVLRPGRFDGALRPHGPGGPARGHFGLSENASPRRCAASAGSWRNTWATACWSISAIRRRTRTTPSGRCGPGSSWSRRCRLKTRCRSPANPRRHCDRARRGRRPDRIGASAGARHRRRDAEPGGAPARGSPSRTWSSSPRHAKASRQSVRAEDLGAKGPQGHRRAGAGLGGAAGEFGGRPLRGPARDRPDRAGRAGRRTRIAAAALVEGKGRRRPGGAALRRGRHRQIAAHRRALERLAGEPHTRLRYFCSPQHTDSAFYPIIGQMERAAGLAHDDKPQAKLDKLDAVLAQTSTSALQDAHSLPRCCRCRTTDAIPRSR